MIKIRKITKSDNEIIASIVRTNLENYGLDIPGTAYFDPELNNLCAYYAANPDKRRYFVAEQDGTVIGGVGVAEFLPIAKCAELQKIYLTDSAKGKGIGRQLLERALCFAKSAGYEKIYLETHSSLKEALILYEKSGFAQIKKLPDTLHNAMNLFYIKNLL